MKFILLRMPIVDYLTANPAASVRKIESLLGKPVQGGSKINKFTTSKMNRMKNIFLLMLLGGFTLTGCRTAFPEAQTPDDVYYSPEINRGDEERTETDEDRYLRMKVRNRRNWNDLNDWYTYERWSYGLNYAYGTPFHPYYNWNVVHNPYWSTVTNTRTPNRPRVSNLNTYQPPSNPSTIQNNPVNPKLNLPRTTGSGSSSNNTRSVGGGLREVFGNGNGNRSSGGDSPASRPSNNNSSPAPSAPVRKF
jgi:hypothetical protein